MLTWLTVNLVLTSLMYGKHFRCMYEGSMYGAGVAVFAVWGYVIAWGRNGTIELNPKKLADTLGGSEEQIKEALEYLQKPDANSRNKARDGRRLIKVGEFLYEIPSWAQYQTIRHEDNRREYMRKYMQTKRSKNAGKPLPGEVAYIKQFENGEVDKFGVRAGSQ